MVGKPRSSQPVVVISRPDAGHGCEDCDCQGDGEEEVGRGD